MLSNKYARVATSVHCLPSKKSQSVGTPAVLAILRFPHDSKCHFLNGNQRQPPPYLPKSETGERCQWWRSRSSWPLTAFVCFAISIIFWKKRIEANEWMKRRFDTMDEKRKEEEVLELTAASPCSYHRKIISHSDGHSVVKDLFLKWECCIVFSLKTK